jgi:hypothetical protein
VCHSKTSTLTGGLDIGEDFPIPIGSFVSSNLTPAGRLKHPTARFFARFAMAVTLMSYTNAGSLSDDDCQAVIAYIRSVPAAGEPTADPPDQVNQFGRSDSGRGHAAERQAGHHQPHRGAAEGPDLSIRRIHPVVSGLPRMPRPSEQSENWVECRLRVLGV